MSERTLWGIRSARAFRVHWALHELGLEYETKPIRTRTPDMETSEFQAISPRKKIPVFEDGDLKLFESCAIVTYLARTYANSGTQLIPVESLAWARCEEWCYFFATELDGTSLYVIRRHGDLSEIYGESRVAVDGAGDYFARQVAVPDVEMADGREYLLGEQFTAADIILTTCLTWAIRYGQPVPDRMMAYRQRTIARPAYKSSFAVCYPDH